MSNAIKKNINKLVSDKLHNRKERLDEEGKDDQGHDSPEGRAGVLADYNLYFSGALDALAAAGVANEDVAAMKLAQEANSTELRAIELAIELEDSLNDEA